MKPFKRILLLLVAAWAVGTVYARPGDAPDSLTTAPRVRADLALSLKSNYISRGSCLGGPGLFPELKIGYGGLDFSAWAFVGFDSEDTKEIDLALGYSLGGWSLGVTDYWYLPADEAEQRGFFRFDAHDTQHQFEGNVGYDFGWMRMRWRTMFAGADYLESGRRAFSTYVALHVPFRLAGLEWEGTAGMTPWKGGYADGVNVVNLSLQASKKLRITRRFSLPLFAMLTVNPSKNRLFFSAGFTL